MSSPATPRPVIILTHEFYPKRGGIATFTEEIARAGAALGHPVEVWAHQLGPGITEPAWPFAVRRLPLPGTHNLTCRLRLAWQIIRHRRRLRHATVYLAEPGPMLTWMLLLPFGGLRTRRLVLTFHGSEILRFHADPATRFFTRRLIRRAFRISTLTRYTQQLLCERFPEAAEKTFRTPGALRAGFAPARAREKSLPSAPASGKIIILTVGRLHPRKGQLATLEALQSLPPAQRERIEYWIVGTAAKPAYEHTLREAAARPGLTVRFLGNLPDASLEEVYAQADIFALTSIDHGHSVEGFGLVYLEASAHGLPVVAHRVGGVAEAVADGETGLLVAPHQPAALTAAFLALITDPERRTRMGAAGRDWARRNTWTRAAELLFHPGDELPDDDSADA